ncbi:embigin [Paroedura picta]|uniref:embigin n=1 Tax=Paroedura picta TaxID=143630 RepID=UPI004056110E
MGFSEARPSGSVALLLALAAACLSAAADPPVVPTTAAETTSHQAPVSTPGSIRPASTSYSSGPSTTAEYAKETTTIPVSEERHNITVKELSTVVKNITLMQPTVLGLICTLEINPSLDKETVEVTWRMGNTMVRKDSATKDELQNIWSTEYKAEIKNRTQLGNYACVFKTKHEAEGRFNVRVPEIEGKSKSIISYEGDSVVMSCNSGKHSPANWVWYTMNGSEEAVINDTLRPEKYEVTSHQNVTKLKVESLAEKDAGFYWCEAVFSQLGESRRNASLKVLTYMAPLKPFLVIVAEVIVLVALIFIYEIYTTKKKTVAEGEKEFEQIEQLKLEDSNGVENSTTRHRKV